MRKTIEFNTKERTTDITLDELKKSVRIREFDGKLNKTRPIEACDLIEGIQEIVDKKGVAMSLDPISVERIASKQVMWRKEEPCPVENWLFPKLITRIQLTDGSNGHNPSIGILYNERGIQVAYGQNVKVCSNFSILQSEHMLSTYGGEKISFEHQMELIKGWIERMDAMNESDLAILNDMMKKNIKGDAIPALVGHLEMAAVRQAYLNQGNAPLNIGQVSTFTQKILGKDLKKDPTVYEVYNYGTEIMKPSGMDINNIFAQNSVWGKFVQEQYLN